MPTPRILLCDDEPLALDRLSELLSHVADVEVAGAFLSGQELIAALAAEPADILLLDIEMPHMDGFDVVDALSRMAWSIECQPPLIVFVTARPEFATDAFDFGALDFVCKPVRLARLEKALDRARRSLAQIDAKARFEGLADQIAALKNAHARADEQRKVWVRRGAEIVGLDVGDIDWIAAEGEYVRIHVGATSYLERGSLHDAAAALEPFGFIRVHRSAIVNAGQITAMDKGRWGQLTLRLGSGTEVAVGKKYRGGALELTKPGLDRISLGDAPAP